MWFELLPMKKAPKRANPSELSAVGRKFPGDLDDISL